MGRCTRDSDRYTSASSVADLLLTLSVTDLDGLRNLANDIAELQAMVHDKWRHFKIQPSPGNPVDLEWLYDSFEYRTWLCNPHDEVGKVLWVSDPRAKLMSFHLSNLAFTLSKSGLPVSSTDIVYFYSRAPGTRWKPGMESGSIAAILCIFIAQVLQSRCDYFGRLNPADQAALALAFQATKKYSWSLYDMDKSYPPADYVDAQNVLEGSEDLLWSIFGGSVTAKRWRNSVVVIDRFGYETPHERHRFLERLSKLQSDVSQAEGYFRLAISCDYSRETDRVLARTFGGFLRLDRTAELTGAYMTLDPPYKPYPNYLVDCMKSFRSHAYNPRRHDIDTAKAYTGAWLFNSESYKKWKESERSCMLCLEGKAGSGKSTLMKHILDSLVQEHQMQYDDEGLYLTTGIKRNFQTLVVPAAGRRSPESDQRSEVGIQNYVIVASYFFHARGGETSHSDMLQSLIYQIVRQDDGLFCACEKRYRRLRERNQDRTSIITWEFEELKQAFLEIVRYRTPSEGRPVSIRYHFLIDALDESDEKKVEQILHLFQHELDAGPNSIKTVLASRPMRNFDSRLSVPGSLYKIMEGQNTEDIMGIYGLGTEFSATRYGQSRSRFSHSALSVCNGVYQRECTRCVSMGCAHMQSAQTLYQEWI